MSRHTHELQPCLCRRCPSAQNRSALSSAAFKGSTDQEKGGTCFMTKNQDSSIQGSTLSTIMTKCYFTRQCLKQFSVMGLACQRSCKALH